MSYLLLPKPCPCLPCRGGRVKGAKGEVHLGPRTTVYAKPCEGLGCGLGERKGLGRPFGRGRGPPGPRKRADCGTDPISAGIDAGARSVLSSAMNSAMRMIVIRTEAAMYSRPASATSVATVTKISVPILRS